MPAWSAPFPQAGSSRGGEKRIAQIQVEKHPARRWLLWLLLIAFIWLVVSRYAEIEKLALTFRTSEWQWVGLAALLQVGRFASGFVGMLAIICNDSTTFPVPGSPSRGCGILRRPALPETHFPVRCAHDGRPHLQCMWEECEKIQHRRACRHRRSVPPFLDVLAHG